MPSRLQPRAAHATGRHRSTGRTGRPTDTRWPHCEPVLRRMLRTPSPAPAGPATGGGPRGTASALCDFLGARDHDILRRDVLVDAAVARLRALDFVDHVLPRRHLAEDAVAPALRARSLVVEEVVVGD